ncbi:hypothetical protein SAMN06265360_1023 [Haloechinothrix alba]|uniref:Cytochrome C biogenesis protein transmembrane region n=1 Tax=Haloechinothrix alba TaxID=664784 RepID=A0A238VB29_9PSEU|nr:hypothetical protein [Haloechinothrix alba]SNR31595.1 hypothetical protein SAMN06265360_1023 [Haloechinothrix alba]
MTTTPQPERTRDVRAASPWRVVLCSALAGVVLAVLWSPYLVDHVIAGGIANPVFGGDIREITITGSGMAIAFAFITGMAGMFTACNVAVFSALAPMTAQRATARDSVAVLLRPVASLLSGAVLVAGLYGAVAVYFSSGMPQLSDARIGDPEAGIPVRLVQAGIVFGVIGVVMLWRGLAYAGIAPNPLAGVFARHSWAEMFFLGGLIGAFLIGRPFPPFRNLFDYAASSNDPLLGFVTFALQSVGNVIGVTVIFVVVVLVTRGRFQRWLVTRPGRPERFAAAAFVVVGTFFVFYWAVKLGYRAGVMWWPTLPYQ